MTVSVSFLMCAISVTYPIDVFNFRQFVFVDFFFIVFYIYGIIAYLAINLACSTEYYTPTFLMCAIYFTYL